jgi:hypothetical protein
VVRLDGWEAPAVAPRLRISTVGSRDRGAPAVASTLGVLRTSLLAITAKATPGPAPS